MLGGIRIRIRGALGLVWLFALTLAACSGARTDGASGGIPPTAVEAARFLTQATYGPTDSSIAQVRAAGYSQWIDQQMVMPVRSHVADGDAGSRLRGTNFTVNDFYYSYWDQAISAPDQLRQRVKFALSEIFVISLVDSSIDPRGAASYYDMLGEESFGNFRTLLERVSLHPMMGIYLTWLGNQKEDPVSGRNPDENFAREIMQLMTIGLYQLNADGTVRTDGLGRPLPTYTTDDISGLARVFTGFSYYSPTPNAVTFRGGSLQGDAKVRAMIPYAAFHSVGAKSFLGTTIPATTTSDPSGDLKIALDRLFSHPNVGPFIGKQLIQRLVTSNPSPAYVARVSAVFANNGKGVRGDISAVVRAILLDEEARSLTVSNGPTYGKVREPIVRYANWARAFGATSASGQWIITSTSANTSLGQSPLTAPSVFNYFRPGYSPPSTRIGNAGLLAPEFQGVDEVTVSGYLNTMQSTIDVGAGSRTNGLGDVRSSYTSEIAIANDLPALADRMDLLLLNGKMSPTLKARIIEAAGSIALPATGSQTTALTNRVKLAIYMTMASSEYLVQR